MPAKKTNPTISIERKGITPPLVLEYYGEVFFTQTKIRQPYFLNEAEVFQVIQAIIPEFREDCFSFQVHLNPES